MREKYFPEGLISGYFFVGNILVLLMAIEGFRWQTALILMPWVTVFASGGGREALRQVFGRYRWLVGMSVSMSVFMFISCQVNDVGFIETKSVLVPFAWIPIAALTMTVRIGTRRWLPDVLLIMAAFLALAVISILLLWQKFSVYSVYIDRPQSLPWNVLCAPILICLFCLMGMLVDKRSAQLGRQEPWLAWVLVIAYFLAVGGSIYTYSKAGALLMMVATLMRWWMVPSERAKTALLALPVVLFWCWELTPRFQVVQVDAQRYQQGSHSGSVGDRIDALRWSFERVGERPFFGRGTDGLRADFNVRWEAWGRQPSDVTTMPHLHNDYLQLMGAYGVPVAMCFGLFWLGVQRVHWQAWRMASGDAQRRSYFSWAVIMGTVFMLAFFVDSFTFNKGAWLMTMASTGLALGVTSNFRAAASVRPD